MPSISKLRATLARREASVVAAQKALVDAINQCKHENCKVLTNRQFVHGYNNNGWRFEFTKVCHDCGKTIDRTNNFSVSPIW